MATSDSAPVTVSIKYDDKDAQRGLAAMVRNQERELNKLKATFTSVSSTADQSFKRAGASIGQSAAAANQNVKNLGFQISDVAVQLSSGTGAVRAFATQADQLSTAILGIAGASAGMTAGIGIGVSIFAALAVAAANYFSETEDGAAASGKALDEHRQKIASVAQAWGDALPALKAYNDELQRQKDAADAGAATASTVEQLKAELAKAVGPMEKIFDLFDGWPKFKDDIEAFRERFAQWRKDAEAGNATHAQTLKLFSDLNVLLAKLPIAAAKKMREEFGQTVPTITRITDAIGDLTKKTKDLTDQANAANDALNFNLPAPGGIPPITSGAGVFDPSQTQVENWNKTKDAIEGATSAAAEFIKKEEGFRTNPYPDPKDLAIGYGMHQYISDAGDVIDITRDMTTTVDEANAQLARQIPRYQQTIINAIGPEMWKSLDEAQKAALTSIAWNYGSLPGSIVKAIQQGDRGQVAKAISELSANPARRQREAALYGGGAFSGAAPSKNFDEMFAANEKLLEQKKRENAINADTSLSTDARTAALDREAAAAEQAKIAEQLLNAAKAQGLTITPELTAKINTQAEAMANAGLKARQLAVDQQKAAKDMADQLATTQQFAQQMSGLAQSAIGGFISDLRAGKDAGEAFNNMLNRIIDSLIQMAIQMAFSPKNFMSLFGGIGGGMGGGFPGPWGATLAKGGIVGDRNNPMVPMNPRDFAGARSYARGGFPGRPPGAIPIYAHPGELVIPKSLVGKGGAGGSTDRSVHNQLGPVTIDMAGSGVVAAGTQQAKEFGENVRALIAQEMVRESRPGGLLRPGSGSAMR